MIYYINNTAIFKNFLNFLKIKNKYKTVYVSLGGKHNEDYLYLNSPSNNVLHCSNSVKQIIPDFLKNSNDEEVVSLFILIDLFPDVHSVNTNYNVISNEMEQYELNIDVIMCNTEINLTLFEEQLRTIMEIVVYLKIEKEDFYICDYIRFVCPNDEETAIENNLPILINDVIGQYKKYSDCFYVWFGQNLFLYNILYNYNNFNALQKFYYVFLQNLFKLHFKGNINEDLIYIIHNNVDKRTADILRLFVKNTLDITSFKGKYYHVL
jgi:hypothetical protein